MFELLAVHRQFRAGVSRRPDDGESQWCLPIRGSVEESADMSDGRVAPHPDPTSAYKIICHERSGTSGRRRATASRHAARTARPIGDRRSAIGAEMASSRLRARG